MKELRLQQQQLLAPGILLWLWIGSQSVLSLTTSNNKATRRDFVNTGIVGTAGLLGSSFPQVSWASDTDDSNSQLPFCVIGANGKTGTKCVQDILNRGMAVKASSRSGVYYETERSENKNPLLLPTVCDVTIPSTIDSTVKGTRAVIFAASASKQGGTPSEGEINQSNHMSDGLVLLVSVELSWGSCVNFSSLFDFICCHPQSTTLG